MDSRQTLRDESPPGRAPTAKPTAKNARTTIPIRTTSAIWLPAVSSSAVSAADDFRYHYGGWRSQVAAPFSPGRLPRAVALACTGQPAHAASHRSLGFFVQQDRPIEPLRRGHPPPGGLVLKVDADGDDQQCSNKEPCHEENERDGGY